MEIQPLRMEGGLLFWLVGRKSHFLALAFTFSGRRTRMENASLYSDLPSSQRPFLVPLDIPKLLPRAVGPALPAEACAPRPQGGPRPAEGARGPHRGVRRCPAAQAARFREDPTPQPHSAASPSPAGRPAAHLREGGARAGLEEGPRGPLNQKGGDRPELSKAPPPPPTHSGRRCRGTQGGWKAGGAGDGAASTKGLWTLPIAASPGDGSLYS